MDNSSHVLRRIAVHMHACMRTWRCALVTSKSLPLEQISPWCYVTAGMEMG